MKELRFIIKFIALCFALVAAALVAVISAVWRQMNKTF